MFLSHFVVIISILNIISFWHTLTNVCKIAKNNVPHRLLIVNEGHCNTSFSFIFTYLIINIFDLPSLSTT